MHPTDYPPIQRGDATWVARLSEVQPGPREGRLDMRDGVAGTPATPSRMVAYEVPA